MGRKYIKKDAMRAIQDRKVEEVEVPEWGEGTVLVCGLSAKAQGLYRASIFDVKGTTSRVRLEDADCKLVIQCVLDPDAYERGELKLYFSDADLEWLGTKSARAIDRIVAVVQRLSGMTKDEAQTIAKNSEAAQSGGLPIALP